MIELSLNVSGVRDTGRVLGISPHGNSGAEKKGAALSLVNRYPIAGLSTSQSKVVLQRVDAAEADEMWSFVGKKREPCWL